MENRTVYPLIRKVLRKYRCLRREEVWQKLAEEHGYYEGDVGKRLREMKPEVECRPARIDIIYCRIRSLIWLASTDPIWFELLKTYGYE